MAETTLLERLRDSELLTPDQLAELGPLPEAGNPDPKALARVVLQRGWLTKFQVSQVAAGKGKDLFVGPYVLLDKLGEGGMGMVLKARHRHMKRVVALKLIRKEKLGGADAVARFYQEVEAAAQLHHPNIVLAFDADQAGTTHFFAMEYVEGPDLTRLVREKGTLPVAQACEFIRQAAVGLQHAHERGLVHRDIKPSNLLVTAGGGEPVVKILDLGLARLGDTFAKERNLTKAGQVIGTPDYLAPEQALDARNVDIRADIYSLGCSLYFLLAARAPFQAESLTELLMKHQMDTPAPIRSLRPDVPPALEALLGRMMAKKAQDRPDTPAEVAAALEPFARGESGGAGRPVPPFGIGSVSPAHGETWASLSGGGEVVARPAARAARSRDTIDEQPRPRRKKEKGNKGLLIGGAIGAGVLVVSLVIGGAVLMSSNKTAKVVEQKPVLPGTQPQEVRPQEVPPVVVVPKVELAGRAGGDGVLLAAIESGVRAGKTARTKEAGGLGGGAEEYADVPPQGALLTGLEVGLGKWGNQDVVYYLRPVYQSRRGRHLGPTFGAKQDRTLLLEAKPGYAIGGITINAGAGLDGLSAQFMAIKGAALDPNDSYLSDWAGGAGGNRQALGGDGTPVVGLFGKLSPNQPPVANGLGLVLLSDVAPVAPPIAPPATPAGDSERLVGGGFGGEIYRDVAPPGGMLVGLEVGLGKFGTTDVTQSIRPIFRSGENESLGPQRGTKLDRVTRLVAKPGYAVGAMNVKTGANADGLSLTFMRVKGAALDPADSSESEWVGDTRPGEKILLSGGGRPVLGVVVKATARDVTGLGLISKPGPTALAGEVRQFPVPVGPRIGGLCFHDDGKRGFTCSGPKGIILDPTTGRQAETYGIGTRRPLILTTSRDGKRVLVADQGSNRTRLLELENGKEIQTLESAEGVPSTIFGALSADGKHALTCQNNEFSLLLWNLETGKLEHTFADLGSFHHSFAFTDDGRYVVACNLAEKAVRVWDRETKRLLHSIVRRDIGVQAGGLVAPVGGSQVLVNREDGNFWIIDCATGKEVRTFAPPASRYRSKLAVSADRKTAVTIGGYDGYNREVKVWSGVEMQVWDVTKGTKVAKVELPTVPRFLALSPDGKSALVADYKTIRYFDLTKLARDAGAKPAVPNPGPPNRDTADAAPFVGHTGAVNCVATSPDGKYLLSGGQDGSVRLWDPATGMPIRVAHQARLKSPIRAVRFTHNGLDVLALDEARDLYHGETKSGVGIPSGNIGFALPPAAATGFDVSTADDSVAAVMGRSLVPMPIRGPQIRGAITSLPASGLCVVSLGEGKLFALGDEAGAVRIADMTKSAALLSLAPHKQPVLALAYNAKTKQLFSGSADKTIKVTSLKRNTKPTPRTFGRHEGEVTCLALSPDGKRLVSGGKDRMVRVWDLATQKKMVEFEDDDEVRGVAFAADGRAVYSAGKTLRVWSLVAKKE